MALTITPGAEQYYPSGGSGAQTFNWDVGTNPKGIVVGIIQRDNDSMFGTPAYDGEALTLIGLYDSIVPGERRVAIYALFENISTGSNAVTFNLSTNDQVSVVPYLIETAGTVAIESSYFASSLSGGYVAVDSGAVYTKAIVIACGESAGTVLATTTEDVNNAGMQFGHEAAKVAGSRSIGWNYGGRSAIGAVLLEEGSPIVEPDTAGFILATPSGVVVGVPTSSTVTMHLNPGGFVLGATEGTIVAVDFVRRVPLIHENETPSYVSNPPDSDVHVLQGFMDGDPEFKKLNDLLSETTKRWVPMVYRPDPAGSPDDWQILHDDDGSVMMTLVEDED